MKRAALNWLFSILGGLVLLFLLAPLVRILFDTSLDQYFTTIQDREVTQSIGRTLWISFLTTVLFAIGGIPLAYLLARKKFRGKSLVQAVIDLPVVIPHSAAGIALLGFVSRDSVVGKIADQIGLDFVGHPAGIAIAMAFVSVPFLINSARDGFQMVPVRLEKTSLVLGASGLRTFLTISIPLAGRSVVSGLVMMFARGLSEFGAIVIIAYHPMVTPVLIWERFGAFGLKYAQPVAAVFILVCLLIFIALRLLSRPRPND